MILQKGYYQSAADAAFTYLIHNPDHEPSKLSLSHYMSLPEVDNDTIRNLMAEPYVLDYIEGVKSYELEFFQEAAARLEKSISSFLESEDNCRLYCEGPYYQDWHPDFITSLSSKNFYWLLIYISLYWKLEKSLDFFEDLI